MKQHLDNMGSAGLRARLRGALFSLIGLVAFFGALGVPLKLLSTTEARHDQLIMAESHLRALRKEAEGFEAAGGFERISNLRREISGDLPRELSRIDLHGALTLLADVSGLTLSTLSVSDFEEDDFESIDDAVGRFEANFSARGTPQQLADLVSLLRRLGYPTSVLEFQMSRGESDDVEFDFNATLGLYQSIPVPETIESDVDEMELPK